MSTAATDPAAAVSGEKRARPDETEQPTTIAQAGAAPTAAAAVTSAAPTIKSATGSGAPETASALPTAGAAAGYTYSAPGQAPQYNPLSAQGATSATFAATGRAAGSTVPGPAPSSKKAKKLAELDEGPGLPPQASKADKRAHHNALERKRRDHIKDSFTVLRDSIPNIAGEKSSRAQILNKATEHIKAKRKSNAQLQAEWEALVAENNKIKEGSVADGQASGF